jgi:hypothetical protein
LPQAVLMPNGFVERIRQLRENGFDAACAFPWQAVEKRTHHNL